MAKIFKFTGYYIDPNGGIDPEDVSLQLQEIGLDVFDHHVRVEEADVDNWYDNHPLNHVDCPIEECEKYFGGANHE